MESTFHKIIRKTGKKPTYCKCKLCKMQCSHPCLGTPDDMILLMMEGYGKRVMKIFWDGAIEFGLYDEPIPMLTPLYDEQKKSCTFFTDGLCELHDLGLKPTEGKLSHHSTTAENFNVKKSIGWAVAKEWINISDEQLKQVVYLFKKLNLEANIGNTDSRS